MKIRGARLLEENALSKSNCSGTAFITISLSDPFSETFPWNTCTMIGSTEDPCLRILAPGTVPTEGLNCFLQNYMFKFQPCTCECDLILK
jgi:hypothetical protein